MSKVQKKIDNFFLKELKKKIQKPLNKSKTNTMTEKPASVSNPESPTIKSMMQSLPSKE